MKQKIIDHLPQAENCFIVCTEKEFGIFDPIEKLPCVLVFDNPEPHLKVSNPNEKEITFLKVDQCIWDDSDGKKCDFILFDDKVFCFAEIKTYEKSKKRNIQRSKAYEQLLATIKEFSNIDFEAYKLEALVILNKKNTFRNSTPKASAGGLKQQKIAIDLLKKNIKFIECNSKTFT